MIPLMKLAGRPVLSSFQSANIASFVNEFTATKRNGSISHFFEK
jgi:hypothetical protein